MKRISLNRLAFAFAFWGGVLCGPVSGAWAQEEPAPPAADPPALAAEADAEKKPAPVLGLAGEGKYRTWTHHVGSADESVVAVRVTATNADGNLVTRTGSGFVLRCDGFVVAPEALIPPNERNFKAELCFVKRDGEELTAPLNPVGRPAFRSRKIPYVTLKVNGSHFPGLPIMNPANVRPDASALVTWAVPDAARPGGVKTFSRRAVIGARRGKEDRYALRLTNDGKTDAPQPLIGAVVTDEKGIAALGILTDAPSPNGAESPALTFATFAHLDYICDEVGLVPSFGDVPVKGNMAALSGMAIVSGGPVRVPEGMMRTFYTEFYRTDVVCAPTFRIDRVPVTVGDYRAYLRRFIAPRLPQKWDKPNELEKDFRRADLPATGMIHEDAAAYAESLGKRLPTAVEWLKASQGANYAWYDDYNYHIDHAQDVSKTLDEQMAEIYRAEKESLLRAAKAKLGDKAEEAQYVVDTPEVSELNGRLFQAFRKYFTVYWMPKLNSPVGFYKKDISGSGVFDVLTNAPEMVIRNDAYYLSGQAPKLYPSLGDPYLTVIHMEGRHNGFIAPPLETQYRMGYQINVNDPDDLDAMKGLFLCHSAWTKATQFYLRGAGSLPGMLMFAPINYPGFRCAK